MMTGKKRSWNYVSGFPQEARVKIVHCLIFSIHFDTINYDKLIRNSHITYHEVKNKVT